MLRPSCGTVRRLLARHDARTGVATRVRRTSSDNAYTDWQSAECKKKEKKNSNLHYPVSFRQFITSEIAEERPERTVTDRQMILVNLEATPEQSH